MQSLPVLLASFLLTIFEDPLGIALMPGMIMDMAALILVAHVLVVSLALPALLGEPARACR